MKNFAKLVCFCALFCLLALSACGRGGGEPQVTVPSGFDGGLVENEPSPVVGEQQAVAPIADEPVGRISVLAPAHFAPILREASRLMNQDMNITIDITTYNPDTHASYWAENVLGFDIFFNDPHQPLMQMAQDGVLADFYNLINNHSDAFLTDFYVQALQSLAIDGDLYFFPLAFGLQYVGINTSPFVPQHYIDEFLQMDSISVNQMMEMYLSVGQGTTTSVMELVEVFWVSDDEAIAQGGLGMYETIAHWTDTNMTFATCRDKTFPGFMAWHKANSFVDLDTRTADLLNPRFVTFLENLRRMYQFPEFISPEIEVAQNFRFNTRQGVVHTPLGPSHRVERYLDSAIFANYWGFWDDNSSYISTPSTMAHGATQYMFAIHNEFLSPINALLPFDEQAFVGFIPLADYRGRLITNMATTFPWKTLSIVDNENTFLAWHFVIDYLLPASVCAETTRGTIPITSLLWSRPNIGVNSLDTSIKRSLVADNVEYLVNEFAHSLRFRQYVFSAYEFDVVNRNVVASLVVEDWSAGRIPWADVDEADPASIQNAARLAVERLDIMHNQALAPMPFVPFYLIEPVVLNMLRGVISAEEAAEGLNELIGAWLEGT